MMSMLVRTRASSVPARAAARRVMASLRLFQALCGMNCTKILRKGVGDFQEVVRELPEAGFEVLECVCQEQKCLYGQEKYTNGHRRVHIPPGVGPIRGLIAGFGLPEEPFPGSPYTKSGAKGVRGGGAAGFRLGETGFRR